MSFPDRGKSRETMVQLARMVSPRGFSIDDSPLTISHGDDVYATAATVRTSAQDSKPIPITKSALEKAIAAAPESNGAALIFSWLVENKTIGMVALTTEQHDRLSKIAGSAFSETTRENGETYYYVQRAAPGSPEMAAFAELAKKKEILFYVSLENSFTK